MSCAPAIRRAAKNSGWSVWKRHRHQITGMLLAKGTVGCLPDPNPLRRSIASPRASYTGCHGALLDWGKPLFRQTSFPVTNYRTAAIAVARKNQADKPVDKPAPHPVHGAIAMGTSAFVNRIAGGSRWTTTGFGGCIHGVSPRNHAILTVPQLKTVAGRWRAVAGCHLHPPRHAVLSFVATCPRGGGYAACALRVRQLLQRQQRGQAAGSSFYR